MKILVTGGRDYNDRESIFGVLNGAHALNTVELLVHGDCGTGADYWADRWAIENHVPVVCFRADWTKYGQKAGPLRNTAMVIWFTEQSGEKEAVVFPGGKGTADCRSKLTKCGVTFINMKEKSDP